MRLPISRLRAYKFHHVGVLTADIEQNIKTLRDLMGHRFICEYVDSENPCIFLRQATGDVSVALFEKPLNRAYGSLVTKTDIMHVAFETEDITAAYEDLNTKGAEILWNGDVIWNRPTIGIKTPEGLIVVIIQAKEDVYVQAEGTSLFDESRAAFNHIGVLSARFRESESYWTRMFNLRKTYEVSADDSGYYVLVDEYFEEGKHDFTIEFFTGPNMYPIDSYTAEIKGETYYHFGYLSPGVENLTDIFNQLVDNGLFPAQEPCADADYATTFLHGPDKIIYEFLTASLGAIEKTDYWEPEMADGINPAIPYPCGKKCVIGVKGGVSAMKYGWIMHSDGCRPENYSGEFGNDHFKVFVIGTENQEVAYQAVDIMLNEYQVDMLDLCADFPDERKADLMSHMSQKIPVYNAKFYPEQEAKLDKISWEKYGYIILGEGLDPEKDYLRLTNPACDLYAYGVGTIEQACQLVKDLINKGIEFLGLSSTFGTEGTKKVIEAAESTGKLYAMESSAIGN